MAFELAKYGLQLPAFSKIGGILANELSVDEAAGRRGLCPARSGCGRAPSLTTLGCALTISNVHSRVIRLLGLPGP
jgi:hypothetical protein